MSPLISKDINRSMTGHPSSHHVSGVCFLIALRKNSITMTSLRTSFNFLKSENGANNTALYDPSYRPSINPHSPGQIVCIYTVNINIMFNIFSTTALDGRIIRAEAISDLPVASLGKDT